MAETTGTELIVKVTVTADEAARELNRLSEVTATTAKGLSTVSDAAAKTGKSLNDNSQKFAQYSNTLRNASFQVTDFIVQVEMGTSAVRAFGQQAPQFFGAFGGIGPVLGLATVAFTTLFSVLSGSTAATKKAVEGMKDIDKVLSDVQKTTDNFSLSNVIKEFNDMDASLRSGSAALMNTRGEMLQLMLLGEQASMKAFAAQSSKILENTGLSAASNIAATTSALAETYKVSFATAEVIRANFESIANGSKTTTEAAANIRKELEKVVISARSMESLKLLERLIGSDADISAKQAALAEIRAVTTDMFLAGEKGSLATEENNKKNQKSLADLAEQYKKAEQDVIRFLNSLADASAPQLTHIEQLQREAAAMIALHPEYQTAIENQLAAAISYDQTTVAAKALAQTQKELAAVSKAMGVEAAKMADSQTVDMMKKWNELLKIRHDEMLNGMTDSERAIQLKTDELDAINSTIEAYAKLGIEITDVEAKILTQSKESAKAVADFGKQIAEGLGTITGDTFNTLIDSFGKTKLSFSDMAESIAKDTAKLVTQILIIKPLMDELKNFDWSGAFGSVFGASTQSSYSAIPSVASMSVPKTYGNVSAPNSMNMASARSVPRVNMPAISNSSSANTNGAVVAVQPVININNTMSEANTVEATQRQTPDGQTVIDIMIARKVQTMLSDGSVDRTLRNNFGLTRAGF